MGANANLKLITEEVVRSFLGNPLLVAEFPFLKLPPAPEETSCCGKQKRQNLGARRIPSVYFNDVKKILAKLPDERLDRLLALVGMSRPVRLIYRDNDAVVNVRRD